MASKTYFYFLDFKDDHKISKNSNKLSLSVATVLIFFNCLVSAILFFSIKSAANVILPANFVSVLKVKPFFSQKQSMLISKKTLNNTPTAFGTARNESSSRRSFFNSLYMLFIFVSLISRIQVFGIK